jgi:uncharacterized protein (TIGR02145 family)
MANNLNYKTTSGSICYDNKDSNCVEFGRLYKWETAMDLPTGCSFSYSCASQIDLKHKGICPTGWHLPTRAEWGILLSGSTADNLKATSDWNNDENGQDTYGFAALPGGSSGCSYGGGGIGSTGNWWSQSYSERDDGLVPEYWYISGSGGIGWNNDATRSCSLSVRCLQD